MSSASARVEKLSSAALTSGAPAASPSRKNASIEPDAFEHLPQHPQQRGDVLAARPPVHHRPQFRVTRARVEAPDELRGPRPQDVEERVDRVQHARDAAEGERRRTEAGDLAIARVSEGPDPVHRIADGLLAVVVAVESVEG